MSFMELNSSVTAAARQLVMPSGKRWQSEMGLKSYISYKIYTICSSLVHDLVIIDIAQWSLQLSQCPSDLQLWQECVGELKLARTTICYNHGTDLARISKMTDVVSTSHKGWKWSHEQDQWSPLVVAELRRNCYLARYSMSTSTVTCDQSNTWLMNFASTNRQVAGCLELAER
jgi:hypothetical protein